MNNLYQYLTEGGLSGHMKHVHDYNEWSLRDIKGLIRNLFTGKIEDITEKIDGTNIQATKSLDGEVLFLRNGGDLNSERGGMTIDDMAAKWADKPGVANTFLTGGRIIKEVFDKIPASFFNPDKNTRVCANCECVLAGKTNKMYYADSQVDFHDLWIYTLNEETGKWENTDVTKKGLDVIEDACKDVVNAHITPKVIIKTVEKSNEIAVEYIKEIDRIFKEAGCKENSTMHEYKYYRFCDYIDKHYPEINDNESGKIILFNRIFFGDKRTNIRNLRMMYEDPTIVGKVEADKELKSWCMEPIDDFFIDLGNDIISLCDGILNADSKDAVSAQLKRDLEKAIDAVKTSGSDELQSRMMHQLARLGDKPLNAAEGIVFKYKGKLTKLTGTFGPLNQVLDYQFKR